MLLLRKSTAIVILFVLIGVVSSFVFAYLQTANAQVCGQNFYYTVQEPNCVYNSSYGEYTCSYTPKTVGGLCQLGNPPYDPDACATPQAYYKDGTCTITNNGQSCSVPYANYHPGTLCWQSGGGGGCNYEAPSCISSSAYSGYPTVSLGQTSSYVEILQNSLMLLGYDLCPYGGSDGYYGSGTANAVYQFKTNYGLGTDPNRFGSSAWNLLDDLVSSQACVQTTYTLRLRSSRYLSDGTSEGISGVYIQTQIYSDYTSGSANYSTYTKPGTFWISAPTTIPYGGSQYNFVKWVINGDNEKLDAYTTMSINDVYPDKTARAFYGLAPIYVCSDGLDNDGDGLTDYSADPGCTSSQDIDEYNVPQCSDGSDNDGDGVTDLSDPGCSDYQDNTENTATTQCQDGSDNDGDGATNYPNDFSCFGPTDNDETNPKAECQDGSDNDGDGVTDLSDPGCWGYQDNTENTATTQCQDGSDNDGDGATDYSGNDFSCSGPTDNDETNPKAQCQDGIDNDSPSDGFCDAAGSTCTDGSTPGDPGCTGKQDNDEYNIPPGSSGTLISSTFDTGISDGVKINSIIWQGSLGVGGTNSVNFQIASSNCLNGATNAPACTSSIGWGGAKTEGDGAFIGPSGTSADWYSPAPNSPAVITTNQHNNKRYFRYMVELDRAYDSTSPVVDDIIINWSP